MNEMLEVENTKKISKSIVQEKTIINDNYFYLFVKRFFDIIGSIVGIAFLIPIVIVVKIFSLFAGDNNSIFFVQDRIGKGGKIFKMIKFRTMVPNADAILEEMLKNDKKIANEYNKYKKLNNDPRITKIGKLLRITSIDEFPQFINVFLGQMSLVGPRPYLPREKKDMGNRYKTIITVKPGLTGYWQVRGRNNTDFNDRLNLDVKYVKIKSLFLDLKILFKTFVIVFKRDGAL